MSPRINARVVSLLQPVRGLAGPSLQRACIIFTRLSLLPESLEVDLRPDFFCCCCFLITLIEDSSNTNGSDAVRLHQRGALIERTVWKKKTNPFGLHRYLNARSVEESWCQPVLCYLHTGLGPCCVNFLFMVVFILLLTHSPYFDASPDVLQLCSRGCSCIHT